MEPALAGPLSLLTHPEGSPKKQKAGKAALREPAPLEQKEKEKKNLKRGAL